MLNQGWQNAFTASVLAFIVLFVIPKACGGEADRDVAESAECFVLWDGREYAIDCAVEETEENEADDFESEDL
ncbi:hypothetical protein [Hoeflea prorocentri]|uniref:Uncharacterized protein n=1 Tax=Hoeflea prorocentri TaxID=1922333 RepID=A0A9X3UHQ9_9HYPH|nr:hypothetical protein [Hoeflea prorocentri]MCY6381040.1 hypothetical protein [Hoeflea prorocentri]MDA5398840.1 hypothetical protein [Hoeflea prorocentri]